MATYSCRDIVTRALRMVGVLGRSEEPEADELRDGMTVLESMYLGWFTGGMFGKLQYSKSDYLDSLWVSLNGFELISFQISPEFMMVIDLGALGDGQEFELTNGTLTLPTLINEECPPYDLAAAEVNDAGTMACFLWDRIKWVQLDSLEPSAPAPLSDRGANALAACLAVNFAEEFGAAIPASVMLQCRNFKAALSFKFGTTQEPLHGQWF